ncbi:universal stress protein [soil metagenome]
MRILLATDTSSCSQAAIESVKRMQYGVNDEIKVVTVIDLFEPLLAVHQAKAVEQAELYVQSVATSIQENLPDCKVSASALVGYPDQVINETAVGFKADLIVMGSHGRTGLTRFFWGSISRAVLMDSPCAVRIVKMAPPADPSRRVLVALDEAQSTQDTGYIMEHVLAASWPAGTEFKCITVLNEKQRHIFVDSALSSGLAVQDAEVMLKVCSALQERVEQLNLAFGKAASTFEILKGDSRVEILSKASEWCADMIVVGTHGHRSFDDVVFGSVADAVSSHAPCSVEIVRHRAMKQSKMHIIV